MSYLSLLSYSYLALLTLLAAALPFRYRQLDKASRSIAWLIWLGLLTETLGWIAAYRYRNNYPVYNISFYLHYILMMRYFYFSLYATGIKRFILPLTLLLLFIGLGNMLFLQPWLINLNTLFLFLKCLCITGLCLYAIRIRNSHGSPQQPLYRQVHFWLPCILLFQQTATICSWGSYQPLSRLLNGHTLHLDYCILIINTVAYLFYALLFLYYPKLKDHEH